MQKRVLAVNDISCVGRCSLTVALPVLSAAGIETSVLPTAILSTHTGGFDGYTFRDLTNDITPIVQHIKSLGRVYDGIFTGYLGSFSQLSEVTGCPIPAPLAGLRGKAPRFKTWVEKEDMMEQVLKMLS